MLLENNSEKEIKLSNFNYQLVQLIKTKFPSNFCISWLEKIQNSFIKLLIATSNFRSLLLQQ